MYKIKLEQKQLNSNSSQSSKEIIKPDESDSDETSNSDNDLFDMKSQSQVSPDLFEMKSHSQISPNMS